MNSQRLSHRTFSLCIAALVCLGSLACIRKLDPLKVVCTEKTECPNGYSCFVAKGETVGHCQVGNTTDAGKVDAPSTIDGGSNDAFDGGSNGGSSGDGGRDTPKGSAGSGGSAKLDAPISTGGTLPSTSSDSSLPTGGTTGENGGATSDTGGVTSATGGTTVNSSSDAGGGVITWPDALPPTDAPGAIAGTACTSDKECSSGHCIDKVCCAAVSCTGCFACTLALTGQPDGTCAPVSNGKIAHSACTDETTTKPCGNDGTCDGKGACRNAAAGKSCGTGSCNASSAYVPAPTCDGKGVCAPGTAQPCSPYPCSATGCDKKCTKLADCDTGTYCDTSTSTCKATKPNGTQATDGTECTSGVVADGVCCNLDCTGCSACTAALNGQDSKTTGTCLPVIAGKAAPHSACPKGADSCGADGTCDGSNHCTYPALGSNCGTKSCNTSTSVLTKGTCESSHTCKQSTASCPGGLACLSDGSDCRPSPCTADTDCPSGSYCTSTGTCAAKSGPGSLCTPATANQCNGAACVDGHCCSVASCGTCQQCTGTGGTCVAVTNTEDPDTCSGNTACDATGACKKKTSQTCTQGTECLSTFCADKVCCDRQCNGSCEYCNTAGQVGQCGYVTGSPMTGHAACLGDNSACKGTCKGGKADCDLPGSETTCRQPSCQSTSKQINRETCIGTGVCPGPNTTDCGLFLCSTNACLGSCSGSGSGQCAAGTACLSGVCRACSGGQTACGSYCAVTNGSDAYNCGGCGAICSGTTPYCSSGRCVACTSDPQCTSGGYISCLSGNCVCRQKNPNNLVPNPGFDGSSSSWTLFTTTAYTSSTDADFCPGSGALGISGYYGGFSVCFPIGSNLNRYSAGFRYRGNAVCSLNFYSDACSTQLENNPYVDTGFTSTPSTWSTADNTGAPVPSGATYAQWQCTGQAFYSGYTFYYDQFWFNASSGKF